MVHTYGGISWKRDPHGYRSIGHQDSLKDSRKYVMADPRVDLEEESGEPRAMLPFQWQTPRGSPIRADYSQASNEKDAFGLLSVEIMVLII